MRINIYLTKEQKTMLTSMCYKYQVSKSTIASTLLFLFTKYMLKQKKGNEKLQQIGKEYIYGTEGQRTCIKPKLDPTNNQYFENNTKAYTNVINIYLKKDLQKWLEVENIQQFYNELNKKLQEIDEPEWNYNTYVRMMARYQRKEQKND